MSNKKFSLVLFLSFSLLFAACGESAEEAPSEIEQNDQIEREVQGVDVSVYQGEVNWEQVRAFGVEFGFARATEGDSIVDSQFANNWNELKAAGIVRGPYHLFNPYEDVGAQADLFIATVTLESGDLPPALDVGFTSVEGMEADIRVWLEKVAEAYGVTPVIFAERPIIEANLSSGFNGYHLWLLETDTEDPLIPGDWDEIVFWNYEFEGSVPGISGAVGLDKFLGTQDEWEQLLVE